MPPFFSVRVCVSPIGNEVVNQVLSRVPTSCCMNGTDAQGFLESWAENAVGASWLVGWLEREALTIVHNAVEYHPAVLPLWQVKAFDRFAVCLVLREIPTDVYAGRAVPLR